MNYIYSLLHFIVSDLIQGWFGTPSDFTHIDAVCWELSLPVLPPLTKSSTS